MHDRPAPPPLEHLRDLVHADPGLQRELTRLSNQALAERILTLASDSGIALRAEDIAPFLRPDPIGAAALTDWVPPRCGWPSPDWRPTGMVRLLDGSLAIDWAHFAGERLADPFYAQTARIASARPFNRLFRYRSTLDDFISGAATEALPDPDGLIFHMSRCGSTLVGQMLAALPESIIVSEPPPLAVVARLAASADDALAIRIVRAMAGALGRGGGKPFVIKLDLSGAAFLPLYRQAFPSVPWLFLSRSPAEVLASQMRSRGPETQPHLAPELGADPDAPEEVQIAQSIAFACRAALDASSDQCALFVDYGDLPEVVFTAILPHFRIDPGDHRSAMAAAALRDAKAPLRSFAPETAVPDSVAAATVRDAAEAYLAPLYARLRALRSVHARPQERPGSGRDAR